MNGGMVVFLGIFSIFKVDFGFGDLENFALIAGFGADFVVHLVEDNVAIAVWVELCVVEEPFGSDF